ncbi:MAG: hypothetical protein FWG70_06620 [Oscillospiraceae bacterium]|nr:hypothetical protein [Oscillospiraceae bacterium]
MATVYNSIATGYSSVKNSSKTEIDELHAAQLAAAHDRTAALFTTNTDKNQTGFDFFFGAGSSLAMVKTMNSARLGIENRARALLSEIRMDQLRGVDTSLKREQLSNLTGNLDIMNKNLGNSIDKATTAPKPKESAPAVIDKINAGLEAAQKREEKAVQEKYGQKEEEVESGDDE